MNKFYYPRCFGKLYSKPDAECKVCLVRRVCENKCGVVKRKNKKTKKERRSVTKEIVLECLARGEYTRAELEEEVRIRTGMSGSMVRRVLYTLVRGSTATLGGGRSWAYRLYKGE